jgi:hypothetical protein
VVRLAVLVAATQPALQAASHNHNYRAEIWEPRVGLAAPEIGWGPKVAGEMEFLGMAARTALDNANYANLPAKLAEIGRASCRERVYRAV